MLKRLASKPAQPRSWISLPGYPTLAAAGLSLCLAGGGAGCISEPAGSPPAPFRADAKQDPQPSSPSNLAGGAAYPFQADADPTADVLPMAADASASIDGGMAADAASPDATNTTIDPGNMAGGEPYLFIPDAGNENQD
jgi:hypothetical protein